MYALIVALFALVVFTPLPAHAQIHVDLGISLPAPPPLVVVREVPAVQYAPQVSANLFFYSGQYWAFTNGGWYVSVGYNGPWVVVAPQFVPRPVLMVPVRYYRVPPGHWKKWRGNQPPRWGNEWGREWADKRAWKGGGGRDEDEGGGPPGRGGGRGHGHGPK